MQESREEILAARVRDACVDALIDAYEDAGLRGLCGEGQWEAAVGSLRSIEPGTLLRLIAYQKADSGS